MAPRKRKGGAVAPREKEKPPTVVAEVATEATTAVAAAAFSKRVTRSTTRGASSANIVPGPAAAKKAKGAGRKTTTTKKKKATKSEENVVGEDEGVNGEEGKEEGAEDGELEEAEAEAEAGGALDSKVKTVVIEHCKQCNSFKTRAIQVKNGLEKGVPGITVVVNPDKPRRGCFEIREEGGEIFISLLDMKRPFGPMKALDMDKVIVDIIDKVKA